VRVLPAEPPRRSAATSRATPQKPAPAVIPPKAGELRIIVRPWALIWLDGKALGQTPYRGKVPAGRHSVRLANDVVGKDETKWVTIYPDRTTPLEKSW